MSCIALLAHTVIPSEDSNFPMIETQTLPRYRLKFTNRYGEMFYFVSLGHRWDEDPLWNRGPDPMNRRLIRRTTTDIAKAAVFDTLPEALEVLILSDNPADWVAETLDGKVVE